MNRLPHTLGVIIGLVALFSAWILLVAYLFWILYLFLS